VSHLRSLLREVSCEDLLGALLRINGSRRSYQPSEGLDRADEIFNASEGAATGYVGC
jgi:hypothetical protein